MMLSFGFGDDARERARMAYLPIKEIFPNDFSVVREKLEAQGLTFLSAEVQMIPQNTVVPADEDTLQKVQKLLEMLEDNDDVQNVWHNAELPEEPDEE